MRNYSANVGFSNAGTVYCEGSTIKFNLLSDGGSYDTYFDGGSKTYNNLWISGTHTGNHNITGSNTFNNITIDAGRKVRIINGSTQTIKRLEVNGTSTSGVTITITDSG